MFIPMQKVTKLTAVSQHYSILLKCVKLTDVCSARDVSEKQRAKLINEFEVIKSVYNHQSSSSHRACVVSEQTEHISSSQ